MAAGRRDRQPRHSSRYRNFLTDPIINSAGKSNTHSKAAKGGEKGAFAANISALARMTQSQR